MDLDNWAALVAIVAALGAHLAVTTGKIDQVKNELGARIGAHDGLFVALDAKLGDRIDTLDTKLSDRIEALDTKLSDRIEALDTKLGDRIEAVDAKADHVRDELLAEMRDGFGRLDTRLTVIEQRTYDLSLRLPPAAVTKHG